MHAWTLPDPRALAAEHAYRWHSLETTTRPLPDVTGGLGRLGRAVRRWWGGALRVPVRPRLHEKDLPLGHSPVCR